MQVFVWTLYIKSYSKCSQLQWGWINSLCKQASAYFVCTSQVYNNFSINPGGLHSKHAHIKFFLNNTKRQTTLNKQIKIFVNYHLLQIGAQVQFCVICYYCLLLFYAKAAQTLPTSASLKFVTSKGTWNYVFVNQTAFKLSSVEKNTMIS